MRIHSMAGHLIRRLNQISTQIFASHMQRNGLDLTPVQFAAMETVAAFPGIDQAGVAAQIAYDRATIGGVIDRLEQKGLVAREVNPKDRRARVLRLTKAGAGLLDRIRPVVAALQDEILAELQPDERAVFLDLARKSIGGKPEPQGDRQ